MFGFSFQGAPRPPFDSIIEASWQPVCGHSCASVATCRLMLLAALPFGLAPGDAATQASRPHVLVGMRSLLAALLQPAAFCCCA